MSRRRVVGTVLLTIAVVAPIGRHVSVTAVEWTPLRLPLTADAGEAGPRDFAVDVTGTYALAVQIDRPADKALSGRAECLLGFDWPECADVVPATDMRWALESADGREPRCHGQPMGRGVVAGRGLSGNLMSGEISRWLACFDLERGSHYRLRVEVAGTAPLQAFRPRVVVQPSFALSRSRHSRTAAVWLMALLPAVAGAALLLSDGRGDRARQR